MCHLRLQTWAVMKRRCLIMCSHLELVQHIYNIEHSNMLNNIMRWHLELQPWQARGSTSRALNDKTAAKSTNYHVPHHLANQANLALYIIIFTGVKNLKLSIMDFGTFEIVCYGVYRIFLKTVYRVFLVLATDGNEYH